jgi:hypothetical protein
MTLARTEMKRGTTALRSTKPMNRGTSTMSRGEGMKRGTAQLARSGPIKAKAPAEKAARVTKMTTGKPDSIAQDAPKARKRPMKTNRPRMTAIRSSAKNQECLLRFPCCNHRIDTTVLCHRNGAGGGMKAPDTDAAYGCYACHVVLDGHAPRPEGFTRDMMLAQFDVAVGLTHIELAAQGLIRFLADGRVEEVTAAEKAAQKNKSRNLSQADSGPKTHQLLGQSMTSKILPQIDSVGRAHARKHADFPQQIPSNVPDRPCDSQEGSRA